MAALRGILAPVKPMVKMIGSSIAQNEKGTYDGNTSIIYQGLTYLHHEPSEEERRFILSVEGCRTLCGSGVQYYSWSQIAGTITTWVLPIIGTLLQAPFDSNQFRKTLYALVRWIGSPIASLAYILWNIKVIGKCALLFDMSIFYNIDFAQLRRQDAESALDIRDALFILSVMNQYTFKSPIDPKHALCLLRIALFSDIETSKSNLKDRRRKLAMTLREGRKRGIVPVFVTLMWFLFAFAISIEGAFSVVGNNTTAHDMALGSLLAWFPVLILSSIVDRNPTQTKTTCKKLNKFLGEVQVALRSDKFANKLRQTVNIKWASGQGSDSPLERENFDEEKPLPLASGFFNEFAGQGRVRWHYGVAHPILTGMEITILRKCEKEYTRNWLQLRDIKEELMRGSEEKVVLLHFDLREFWEILCAFLIVIGTISGAFILSFRTPTIGLGCRAGGYAIFGILAAALVFLELLTWYYVVAPAQKELNRIGEQLADEIRKQKEDLIATLNWTFRFCELVNTAWLIYIVMAQTLGSYRNCDCQSSIWSRGGGYINVKFAIKADLSIQAWWITGVLLSSLIMLTAIAFLVVEWCEQSHLNAVDREKAIHGLKVTQHFKYRTLWIRRPPVYFVSLCKSSWKGTKARESITWSS
ncbi:hypothetical protein MMC07_003780 [Pseudocyphellaria aurata]|nr:hypothetical protein [Pseudocyphellaria aurata]